MRGGRLASGWGLILAAALAAMSLQAAAQAAGSRRADPSPPYLRSDASQAVLYSNAQWKVATRPSRQFSTTRVLPGQSYKMPGGDAGSWIWAPTCSTAPQQVEFHRTVWLPGRPDDAQLTVDHTVMYASGYSWDNPFRSITFVVNGDVLHKATTELGTHGEFSDDLDTRTLHVDWHPGNNLLDVIAVKRANPSFIKNCAASPTRLGLAFAMILTGYDADMAVKQTPDNPPSTAFKVQPGDREPVYLRFTVSNNGPAASQAGTFTFLVQPGFMIVQSDPNEPAYYSAPTPLTVTSTGPLQNCMNPTPHQVACAYNNWWQPGAVSVVTVAFHMYAPTDESTGDVEDVDFGWGVASTSQQRDPVDNNNTHSFDVYYCYSPTSDPRCAGAS